MTTRDQNHALALAIIERKNAEIVALTQRAEAAEAERDVARSLCDEMVNLVNDADRERDALRKVDDAMVWRALVAWFDEPGCPEEINSWGKVQKDSVDGGAALRVFMREALDAALAVQP